MRYSFWNTRSLCYIFVCIGYAIEAWILETVDIKMQILHRNLKKTY